MPQATPPPRLAPVIRWISRQFRRPRVWPWRQISPLAGAAAVVTGAALAASTWWRDHTDEWRESNADRLSGFASTWWAALLFTAGGVFVLVGWKRWRRRVAASVNQPGDVDVSGPRHWSNAISAVAAAVTVLVAVAALLYTDAANREQARLAEQGQVT
jgi:hypothetical protein